MFLGACDSQKSSHLEAISITGNLMVTSMMYIWVANNQYLFLVPLIDGIGDI